MATTVPFKTQLGNDELRSRTLKLGQRHRTILFLIDGRRPLAEVLSLAQQAGAATQHFEDLLRLGLVELPPDPTPPAPPELPVLSDTAELTTVELVVPPDPDDEVTVRAPLMTEELIVPQAPAEEDEIAPPILEPLPVEPAPVAPPQPRASVSQRQAAVPAPPIPEPVVAPPPTPRVAPKTRASRQPPAVPVLDQAIGVAPPQPAAAPVPRSTVAEAPVDLDLPLPDEAEAQFLQRVRDLLTDTLRIDAPVFSARTFMRVRNAQSAGELIDLVWEIQDHLSTRRRSPRELQSLQRARELLGLGNTLVSDDETRPPYLDE